MLDRNVAATTGSLAERKRQLVRQELAEAAVKVLAVQGFEETTVEQIVATAGVSRRTFSRYFESKEDVVVHVLAQAGEQLSADLRARPADETPPVALRHALSCFVQISVDHPEKMLCVTRLMLDSPGVLARFLERQTHWQADMAETLARRSGLDPRADLRPALAAGVALSTFHTALSYWADNDGRHELAKLVDQAFSRITPVLELTAGGPIPRNADPAIE